MGVGFFMLTGQMLIALSSITL